MWKRLDLYKTHKLIAVYVGIFVLGLGFYKINFLLNTVIFHYTEAAYDKILQAVSSLVLWLPHIDELKMMCTPYKSLEYFLLLPYGFGTVST